MHFLPALSLIYLTVVTLITSTSAASIRIHHSNETAPIKGNNITVTFTSNDSLVSPLQEPLVDSLVEDDVTKMMSENADLKNKKTKRVVIITLGTRGDIQPYQPLAKEFERRGVECYIASHAAYQDYIVSNGIRNITLPGADEDIKGTIQAIQTGMSSPTSIAYHASAARIAYMEGLLKFAYERIRIVQPDLLLSVPWFFGAPDLAEKLQIPLIHLSPFPVTETAELPFFMADSGAGLLMANKLTYKIYQDFGEGLSMNPIVNRWRTEVLQLPSRSSNKMTSIRKFTPIIYGYSPILLPKSIEWEDPKYDITVSGFWSLPTAPKPTARGQNKVYDVVTDFIDASRTRTDYHKLVNNTVQEEQFVYIGFGSMEINKASLLAIKESALQLIRETNCSVIFHVGGTGGVSNGALADGEIDIRRSEDVIEPSFFAKLWKKVALKSASAAAKVHKVKVVARNKLLIIKGHIAHDWFMDQMDLAVHHGGAGTMFTMMKAGVPSIIKPFFGDQRLWAAITERRNLGSKIENVSEELVDAAKKILEDSKYKKNMMHLKEKLQFEDSVTTFMHAVDRLTNGTILHRH